MSDPSLGHERREELVRDLMRARRLVGQAKRKTDQEAEKCAHAAVDQAKRELGERGPVWWSDGAPDYNRHLVKNTPYAGWFAAFDR